MDGYVSTLSSDPLTFGSLQCLVCLSFKNPHPSPETPENQVESSSLLGCDYCFSLSQFEIVFRAKLIWGVHYWALPTSKTAATMTWFIQLGKMRVGLGEDMEHANEWQWEINESKAHIQEQAWASHRQVTAVLFFGLNLLFQYSEVDIRVFLVISPSYSVAHAQHVVWSMGIWSCKPILSGHDFLIILYNFFQLLFW